MNQPNSSQFALITTFFRLEASPTYIMTENTTHLLESTPSADDIVPPLTQSNKSLGKLQSEKSLCDESFPTKKETVSGSF